MTRFTKQSRVESAFYRSETLSRIVRVEVSLSLSLSLSLFSRQRLGQPWQIFIGRLRVCQERDERRPRKKLFGRIYRIVFDSISRWPVSSNAKNGNEAISSVGARSHSPRFVPRFVSFRSAPLQIAPLPRQFNWKNCLSSHALPTGLNVNRIRWADGKHLLARCDVDVCDQRYDERLARCTRKFRWLDHNEISG